MCPPDYYEVAYEINPWMSVKRKVNLNAAKKQWEDFYHLLTGALKVKVELLKPVPNLPDLVFTANGGLVWKKQFLRANFRHKERQPEARFFPLDGAADPPFVGWLSFPVTGRRWPGCLRGT